jgi:hypothetical protein
LNIEKEKAREKRWNKVFMCVCVCVFEKEREKRKEGVERESERVKILRVR